MVKVNNPIQVKILIVLLTSLMLSGLNSCHKNSLGTVNKKTNNMEEKSAQLIDADNAFGLELFKRIRDTGSEENLLISPFSVSVALAMAYNGANAETKSEMEEVMQLNGLTPEHINGSYQKLISDLQSLDEKVVFEIANAIYYAEGFSVQPDFLSVTREVYDAEINGLDFSAPSAVETINNWVDEKTNGKINEIIQHLKPLDRMLLLNAIYFYGTWSREFDKNGTQNREFIKAGGTTVKVPMMNKLDTLPYFSADIFKAIKLPYGSGRFNMVVLLPHNGKSTQDIISNLSAENWKTWMQKFEPTERVDVTMPRFKFAFETSLKDVLAEMGMQKAFIPQTADFSGISEEEVYISEVKHKTYIDVNETGTEAAAVTSIGFAATSFGDEPPTVPFFVDKPFLFVITEIETGALIFIGEVKHPEY